MVCFKSLSFDSIFDSDERLKVWLIAFAVWKTRKCTYKFFVCWIRYRCGPPEIDKGSEKTLNTKVVIWTVEFAWLVRSDNVVYVFKIIENEVLIYRDMFGSIYCFARSLRRYVLSNPPLMSVDIELLNQLEWLNY